MKTSELTGAALDWAVAKAEGHDFEIVDGAVVTGKTIVDEEGLGWDELFTPSTDWSQGGPIIEREEIYLGGGVAGIYHSFKGDYTAQLNLTYGHTPLIAAMRCFVSSKLGNEVEIPQELL